MSCLFIYSFAICFICNCSRDYTVDVHKDLLMAIVKTTGLWVVCITDGGYKLLHIVFFFQSMLINVILFLKNLA